MACRYSIAPVQSSKQSSPSSNFEGAQWPALPASTRKAVVDRIARDGAITGATSSSGMILGKNYLKQVDVVISHWVTGPELVISTKRMDSSYGKNAPNRIEESYGDAKNLRLRHPLAALGFVFGLRSDIPGSQYQRLGSDCLSGSTELREARRLWPVGGASCVRP